MSLGFAVSFLKKKIFSFFSGENVSNATKLAREHNLGTYGYDATSSFGRRIDLMLKLKDSTIELSSNEWKSKRTRHMLKKQQSKNIRSNCAILNKLFITSKMSINQTKAVDVVGKNTPIASLWLPLTWVILQARLATCTYCNWKTISTSRLSWPVSFYPWKLIIFANSKVRSRHCSCGR